VEPSDPNAEDMPKYVKRVENSEVTAFAMPDSFVDLVGNLAGLHHTFPRKAFYTESFRVLRPGGVLALADVLEGSPVARWLNEFVNQYNAYGHHGFFFPEGEMSADLKAAGFCQITERVLKLAWNFKKLEEAIEFCRNLFLLNKASDADIVSGMKHYLGFEEGPGEVRIPWQLIYASGRRF
jgi:SAM-dependent methyltransferase